jgi:hypothetical protein
MEGLFCISELRPNFILAMPKLITAMVNIEHEECCLLGCGAVQVY